MRVLIVNPPHPSIGSRIPREHLPPLGLLQVGGPLVDAGHEVRLLDAEFGPLSIADILREASAHAPDAVLLGHSGSTSGHPVVAAITRAIRQSLPEVKIVYGGVFPTYHWREVLREEPQIDVVVRGEGEETAPRVMAALESGSALESIAGIALRRHGAPFATAPAAMIRDLDAVRTGWELIDPRRYSYWGDRRAVVGTTASAGGCGRTRSGTSCFATGTSATDRGSTSSGARRRTARRRRWRGAAARPARSRPPSRRGRRDEAGASAVAADRGALHLPVGTRR